MRQNGHMVTAVTVTIYPKKFHHSNVARTLRVYRSLAAWISHVN